MMTLCHHAPHQNCVCFKVFHHPRSPYGLSVTFLISQYLVFEQLSRGWESVTLCLQPAATHTGSMGSFIGRWEIKFVVFCLTTAVVVNRMLFSGWYLGQTAQPQGGLHNATMHYEEGKQLSGYDYFLFIHTLKWLLPMQISYLVPCKGGKPSG